MRQEQAEEGRAAHLEENGVPAGVFPVFPLRSARYLDRFFPTFPPIAGDPDPDILVFLVLASKPGRHQTATGLLDGGGVTLWRGLIVKRVDEFR